MPSPVVAKIAAGFALAIVVAVFVPQLADDGAVPALGILLVTAVCVGALTTGA